ncbi:hypothetical protein PSHT_03161 [Puccinia striiformis]|uniref:Uncharacterized protein n=1 Tax=Puccinia striiformis TaxID=27350 RepID=A0A2S4WG55_9BASI|nr:hypothetical protein PSHT_03161 [Puccinia striiformis]
MAGLVINIGTILKPAMHLNPHYYLLAGPKKPSMMSNLCNSANLVRPRVKIGGVRKTSCTKTGYLDDDDRLKADINPFPPSSPYSVQPALQPAQTEFEHQESSTHVETSSNDMCNSTNLARPRVKIWGFRKTSLHEHRISRRRRRESIRTRVLERLKPDANLFPLASPYSSQPALHPSHPEVQRQESSTHVETGLNDNAWFDESTANLPHHPGPYEEIDFGLPHYQDEQLQPDVTSSIQQATHPISSDLPGPDQGPSNQVETGLNDNSWFDEYTANLPQHPGPYKEFDFSVLFSKDVRIQTGPTSSNQQPTNPISSDLPGHSMEALPQEFERKLLPICIPGGNSTKANLPPFFSSSTNASGAQSDTECSRRRKTVRDGIAGAIARGAVKSPSSPEISGDVPVPGLRRRRRGLLPGDTRGVGLQVPRLHEEMGSRGKTRQYAAHWVSHSDDTPFACNVEEFHPPAHGQEPCSRIYKRVNELKKHVQNDHNVQVWQKGFSRTRAFAEMDTDEAPGPTQGQQRR